MLFLPLLLEHEQSDLKKKQRRVMWILNAANTYFFLQAATWAGFMFAYRSYEDRQIMFKVNKFDIVNIFLPAIVLIISVLLFRCRFNSKQSQKFFARERIIIVHLTIFLSSVILYAAWQVLTIYWSTSPEGSMQVCRLFVSEWYFEFFYKITNIATLSLLIYMSVLFSRPLSGYW